MPNVLILGAGRQGRVVARDLAPRAKVSVADIAKAQIPGVQSVETDLSDPNTLTDLISNYDLAIGCLPARLGFQPARAAIDARRNYIDIAFAAEDIRQLHSDAQAAGVTVVPDCGVAPGISNLIVGRAIAQGGPDEIHIKVGGIAQDPSRPYGYVVTWSVEDLLDEYTRPARIVRAGRTVAVPALSGVERVRVEGVGELEAFFTDGLRTLLDCGVPEMTEKTLRWPGHADKVRPLLLSGSLVEELRARCSEGEDLLVLVVDTVRGGNRKRTTLIERPRDGLTAMSRATAFTCAAFARWALEGGLKEPGVVPPERIGADANAYSFILSRLREHGIEIRE